MTKSNNKFLMWPLFGATTFMKDHYKLKIIELISILPTDRKGELYNIIVNFVEEDIDKSK